MVDFEVMPYPGDGGIVQQAALNALARRYGSRVVQNAVAAVGRYGVNRIREYVERNGLELARRGANYLGKRVRDKVSGYFNNRGKKSRTSSSRFNPKNSRFPAISSRLRRGKKMRRGMRRGLRGRKYGRRLRGSRRRGRRRGAYKAIRRIATRVVRNIADWSKGQNYSQLGTSQWNSVSNKKNVEGVSVQNLTQLSSYFDSCIPAFSTGTTITFANLIDENVLVRMHKSHMILTVANNYSYTANFDMFWMKCICDTNTGARTMMATAFDDYLIDNANAAITDGEDRINWTFKSVFGAVKDYWRCRKHRRLTLAPGQSATLTFPMDPVVRNTRDITTAASNGFLRGWTYELAVQLWGQLAHDETTATLVGVSPCTIDSMYKWHSRFSVKKPRELRRGVIQEEDWDTITATVVHPALEEFKDDDVVQDT